MTWGRPSPAPSLFIHPCSNDQLPTSCSGHPRREPTADIHGSAQNVLCLLESSRTGLYHDCARWDLFPPSADFLSLPPDFGWEGALTERMVDVSWVWILTAWVNSWFSCLPAIVSASSQVTQMLTSSAHFALLLHLKYGSVGLRSFCDIRNNLWSNMEQLLSLSPCPAWRTSSNIAS